MNKRIAKKVLKNPTRYHQHQISKAQCRKCQAAKRGKKDVR